MQLELRGLELGIIKGAEGNNLTSENISAGNKTRRVSKSKNKSIVDKNDTNES